jgi:ferrochelatase
MAAKTAILTIGHGTVDDLDDLPAFLAMIRRGHPAPPALVAEVRRRYEAIGGSSPLTEICREVTRKLGELFALPAAYAARLWTPLPEVALADLAADGVDRVVVLPLAQHSAPIYVEAVRRAARARSDAGAAPMDVVGPGNWGREPKLTQAFAASLHGALTPLPESVRPATCVLFTAHSLPVAVIRGGDPYEHEVRASAGAVATALGAGMPRSEVVFQSQGMGGGEWLGPDVATTIERLASEGVKHVVFAPIGFLADHVEVLYDLDIEARGWAEARGMSYSRTASLNASDALVAAVAAVAAPFIAGGAPA